VCPATSDTDITEQNLNAVERLLVYADLPPEAQLVSPNDPPPSWPADGAIEFSNVDLAYRDGLPLVLKDVSFRVNAGEKVRSIILQKLSRTKTYRLELWGGPVPVRLLFMFPTNRSSVCFNRQKLLASGTLSVSRIALLSLNYLSTGCFRIVELSGGKIIIDGQNIRDVGLNTLRMSLALVPQDSTLFFGTLRENL
jgi:ABC-type transport system involved in Fe-S cluster assembly fused permease/ATPase subunit